MVKEADISAVLQKKGFVLLDAGLAKEVGEIRQFIEEYFPIASDEFYYSLLSNSLDDNIRIRAFINAKLRPFYNRYFDDFKTRNESFLSKPKHTQTELLLHQDWNYTDESLFNAYNLWIPLSDVSIDNGAMFFIPESHLWLKNLRSGSLLTARIASEFFDKDDLQIVELKLGQAVLFHPAVFHGSFSNNSSYDRTIVTSTIFDRDAPFLYYQKTEAEGQVKVYSLNDNAYMQGLDRLSSGHNPQGANSIEITYEYSEVSAGLLKSYMSKAKEITAVKESVL